MLEFVQHGASWRVLLGTSKVGFVEEISKVGRHLFLDMESATI